MVILQLNAFFIQILFKISKFSLKLLKIDHFMSFVVSKKSTQITNPLFALLAINLILLTVFWTDLEIPLILLQISDNGQIFGKIWNLQINSLNLEIINFTLKFLLPLQKPFQTLSTYTMPTLEENPRLSGSEVERKETKIALKNLLKHY